MKNNNKVTITCGNGTMISLLQVLFVGLKLTGFIDWKWIWVLAPTWGSFAIILLVLLAIFMGAIFS